MSDTDSLALYDWSEISKHNQTSDCWVVIDGFVYDVTGWIERHPGGQLICTLAGEDVSAMFHSVHFRDISSTLECYLIGQVREYQSTQKIDNDFLPVLKHKVLSYFVENKIDYRSTQKLGMQLILSLLMFGFSWWLLWIEQWWPAAISMGLISCAMVGGLAHEYSHNNVISKGNRNNVESRLMSVLWACVCPFMFEKQFQYEHFKHHMAPMDSQQDYEVQALSHFIRLSPEVSWKPIFRFQHLYAPFVYMYYITIQVIGGAFYNRYFAMRKLRADPAFFFQMYPATAVTVILHVILPIYFCGWGYWLFGFLAYNAVWQCATYLVAAVPHMAESDTTDSNDWAFRSCFYTRNVLCGNAFYDWLSGGFNYQIEHHLLPSISRENLPKISSIVRETCEEFGYSYYEYRHFSDYLKDHYHYLKKLSTETVA